MNRRELLLLVAGAITAGHGLRAQQKAMPVIGYLSGGHARCEFVARRISPGAWRGRLGRGT